MPHSLTDKRHFLPSQVNAVTLPFALPIVEGKKWKKKCCRKFKKGKRCKRCPGNKRK